ncbi:DoxX family protein [Salinicoccus albus]|uniref:DoxX family protein n=1 Tax=Salinicoccus albus TaxID=418756 RepID=UPI00037D9684|nr:DoxX family protein [Salinicoccus albus]
MIHYLLNAFIGKTMFDGGISKVQNKGQMGEEFEQEFNVDDNQMKVAGYLETAGAIFMLISFLGKTFTRIGAVFLNVILGVAIFKHLRAGHGYEGSKNALKFFGLNTLSFIETFRTNNK